MEPSQSIYYPNGETELGAINSVVGHRHALGECGEPIRLPRPVARVKRDGE